MQVPRIKQFLLNNEPVTRQVASFDPAMRYVDVLVLGGDGRIIIEDGKPKTERLIGDVQIEWENQPLN
jgi:hypothetical protein